MTVLPVANAALPTAGILSWQFQRSADHRHQGIDLRAPKGTPVYASASGTVEHAHTRLTPGFSGYGRVVVVRTGSAGPWLLYAHLDEVQVGKGDKVKAGQQIGTVGTTCFRDGEPNAQCAPHLHFEVSPTRYPQDSEAPRLDPVAWLQGGGGWLVVVALLSGVGWWFWRRRG